MACLHPVFHVSLLTPYCANDSDLFPNHTTLPPPPILLNDELEYEVSEILDFRYFYHKPQYLVKWTGYSDPTWEPPENLENSAHLLNAFKQHRQPLAT